MGHYGLYKKNKKSSTGAILFEFLQKNLRKKYTKKPTLVVQHCKKLTSLFYKNYSGKLKKTFQTINIISSRIWPTVKLTIKSLNQKLSQPANNFYYQSKKI